MKLQELIDIQMAFDKQHGWDYSNINCEEFIESLNKELIGLIGEVGEFSNIVKKINLYVDRFGSNEIEKQVAKHKDGLSEELIDSMIYLFRIASMLSIDIGVSFNRKLVANKEKYLEYELKNDESL
ncbi:MAG: hypothetical protein PHO32_04320 [Candidatus Cloacimonetes bacterium]|nr:hypothetical protein [Candidatus Cloacimonadota bacterium]